MDVEYNAPVTILITLFHNLRNGSNCDLFTYRYGNKWILYPIINGIFLTLQERFIINDNEKNYIDTKKLMCKTLINNNE